MNTDMILRKILKAAQEHKLTITLEVVEGQYQAGKELHTYKESVVRVGKSSVRLEGATFEESLIDILAAVLRETA